jgi:hypothetical protein
VEPPPFIGGVLEDLVVEDSDHQEVLDQSPKTEEDVPSLEDNNPPNDDVFPASTG